MSIGLITGVLLALLILIILRLGTKSSTPMKAKRRASNKSARTQLSSRMSQKHEQWHAVRLRAGHDCCDSISYVQDKIYLAEEAPTLPLSSCRQPTCRCTYEHFADRRQELRRDPYSQYGLMASQHTGEERRNRGRGRRETDLVSV